jgi:hypothetical protein
LQLGVKSARRAEVLPLRAKFGVNLMTFQSQRDQYASRLTKMRSILRQPEANFATAKFGLKTVFDQVFAVMPLIVAG